MPAKIKASWIMDNPGGNPKVRKHSQECASHDVARTVVESVSKDPLCIRAMAYWTDDRGAFAAYERK